jgi:Family of unknown function (DUF6502)
MPLRTRERMQSDYSHLLASIFDFMRKSGIRDADVKGICDEALHISARGDRTKPTGSIALSVAALALDAWHRNRRYLDRNAEPRAIRLFGQSPSVEALIRAERGHPNPRALVRQLKSLGLLIRSGRNQYKPIDRIALFTGLDPTIQQYIARASANLLKTIRHNISRGRESSRLIERFAEVPDLPKHRAAEFRRFARAQGWEFLRTLNDWLESRRSRRVTRSRSRTVRAGVHLYAYVEPTHQARAGRTRRL